jgi:hypothetical protein
MFSETKTLNEVAIEIVTRYFNRLIDEDFQFDPTEKTTRADTLAGFIRAVKVGQAIYSIEGVAELLEVRAELLNNKVIEDIVDAGVTELIFLLGPDNYQILARDVGNALVLSSVTADHTGIKYDRPKEYADMFTNNPWLVYVYLVAIAWFSEKVEKDRNESN